MKEGSEKEFGFLGFGKERLGSNDEGELVGKCNAEFCIVRTIPYNHIEFSIIRIVYRSIQLYGSAKQKSV